VTALDLLILGALIVGGLLMLRLAGRQGYDKGYAEGYLQACADKDGVDISVEARHVEPWEVER
jgi:hypothetical protein